MKFKFEKLYQEMLNEWNLNDNRFHSSVRTPTYCLVDDKTREYTYHDDLQEALDIIADYGEEAKQRFKILYFASQGRSWEVWPENKTPSPTRPPNIDNSMGGQVRD